MFICFSILLLLRKNNLLGKVLFEELIQIEASCQKLLSDIKDIKSHRHLKAQLTNKRRIVFFVMIIIVVI